MEKDINGNEEKTYRFEYNPELLPPYGNYGVDIWGCYNGAEGNKTLSYWKGCQPVSVAYDILLDTGDRDPNEEKMQACLLTRMYYPTKGYTDFEYESNRHAGTINLIPHIMGGVRIKAINNFDHDGKLVLGKEYKYGENEDGFGKLIRNSYNNNAYEREFLGCGHIPCTYNTHSYPKLLLMASHPIEVPSLEPHEVIFYPYVAEYIHNGEHLLGVKRFVFDFWPEQFIMQDIDILTNYRYSSNAWKRGNLLQEEIYEGTDETNLQLVYKKTNQYTDEVFKRSRGLSVSSKWSQPSEKDMVNMSYYSIYEKFEENAVRWLSESTESYYTSEGTISKKTKYLCTKVGYFGDFMLPYWKKEFIGKDSITTYFKYSDDVEGTVYSDMSKQNILPLIEKRVYKNGVFMSSIKTNYMSWLNHYVPSSVETQQGSAATETRIRFEKYNKGGKPAYIIKDDYTKVVYLWGHRNQYPVAEIKNATYEEVLGVLSEDNIEFIANSTFVTSQVSYYLNLLYEGLPNAQVKLSGFDPLWGMISETDPRKNRTYYDYDAFGRLKNSYFRVNGANQVIEEYQYHYKP